MTSNGVEELKREICKLLKKAASDRVLVGDEPLVVLLSLAAKMVSEIKDDITRKVMAEYVGENFPHSVELFRGGVGQYSFPQEGELLH